MKKKQENQTKQDRKAIMWSFGLHVALVLAIVVSISFDSPQIIFANTQASQPVKAVFIDAQAIADKRKKQQQAEAQARAKAKREEQARQAKLEKQRKAREQKRKEEAARKKRQQEQKRKQEEAKRKQEEQRALEKAAREEAEIKRRIEEERKEREALEREMAEQLKKEQEALQAAQQQRVMTELDKYRSLIYQTIYSNLFVDESAQGKECRLTVKLASDGLVISVVINEGDAALCQAARSAILRPSRLPVSDDPAVFEQMKSLKITVKPTQ